LWRPGFRYQEHEEEVEHEAECMQGCKEHVDIPSMTQESPVLEIPLIAPANSLGEE